MNTVDARGLSCPQPVLLTLEAIEKLKEGELVVLVDTEAARENVSRAVTSKGWQVKEIIEENGEYKLIT
ncbi:sulfurtransferase TusA family protein [Thermodesulfatator autotrophicus]|uniref:Preprotein translocase subunit TatB n=1 Tax=Thermodesulfatator autotrophicus TaxID=1795632 RepID=A0A177EB09_9BACT|nr:sulfurtransferase TusA family protein [Thermodesulfatator autotrophicus]OAG28189.1 preprotein translocase subunit TatB [Thermodesulfatator autotrophicus]